MMTEENKNNPFHPDFHRDLLSRIPRQPTPFHSNFHREVALWLQNNRHLSSEERILEVAMMMFRHGMTPELLIHYAASNFITLDAWDKFRNDQLPEIFSVAGARNIKSGKDIAEYLEKERRTQNNKTANQVRNEKFQAVWDKLESHWQNHLTHIKSAVQAAKELEKTDFFKNSDLKPEREVIARHIREWKKKTTRN